MESSSINEKAIGNEANSREKNAQSKNGAKLKKAEYIILWVKRTQLIKVTDEKRNANQNDY